MTDNTAHEKMIEKLRKILSLAENNENQQEAENAWAKAQQLAATFQLDLEQIRQSSEEHDEVEMTEMALSGYVIAWKRQLLSALCAANDCTMLFSSTTKFVLGEKSDVDLVTTLAHRIAIQMTVLANSAWYASGIRYQSQKQAWCNSYLYGMALGIRERLRAAKAAASDGYAAGTALVLARAARTEDFVNEKYPKLRPPKKAHVTLDWSARDLGYADSGKVQMQTAIGAR